MFLPVSPSVDFRHNLAQMGYHFGVRNELTRKFTEEALAELFKTYADLDGLYGAMGEAVPGKRSTWYRDAVAPGLKRSGREPIFLAASWMQPLEDFLDEMAPKELYGNTWLAVHSNAEKRRANREGPSKDELEVAVLLLAQLKLGGNPDRRIGQCLPVHIVNGRGEEEQPANPPFPGIRGRAQDGTFDRPFGRGSFCHAVHE